MPKELDHNHVAGRMADCPRCIQVYKELNAIQQDDVFESLHTNHIGMTANKLQSVLATGQTVIPPMTVQNFNDGGDY